MARVTKAQQAVRRKAVAEGIVAGKSIVQIAGELGVHRDTVSDDLKAIGSSVEVWAEGAQQAAQIAAISNYEWALSEARAAFYEDRATLRKWLAGAYDRTELYPDADGGYREVRKPPILRLDPKGYLAEFISANQKLTKMTGVEGVDKLEATGKDGQPLIVYLPDNGRG